MYGGDGGGEGVREKKKKKIALGDNRRGWLAGRMCLTNQHCHHNKRLSSIASHIGPFAYGVRTVCEAKAARIDTYDRARKTSGMAFQRSPVIIFSLVIGGP